MRRSGLFPLVAIVVVTVASLAATLAAGNSPELGLDLQGGASVVLEPTDDASGEQLDQAIEIIRNRVDALGVAEADITRQGGAVVVQLPGVRDQARALDLVGQTAELRFRPVLQVLPPEAEAGPSTTAPPAAPGATDTVPPETTAPTTSDVPPASPATEETGSPAAPPSLGENAAGQLPSQEPPLTTVPDPASQTTVPPPPIDSVPEAPVDAIPGLPPTGAPLPENVGPDGVTPPEGNAADASVVLPQLEDGTAVARYLLGPAALTGEALEGATARFDNVSWTVAVVFKGSGIDAFNRIAQTCFAADPTTCPTRQIAIELDGVVQSAPQIQPESATFEPFARDQVQISGSFTESSAKDLALSLRYGALPVELEPQTVQTVSASLGRDSLEAGLIAGFAGLALVVLYMLLYYRALGLVVLLGLAVWAGLMFSVVSYLGANAGLALSLAGVTGIVVSVGVTVDSYVVYFERLKDEVRSGKSLRSSTERGFRRAFRTILAADTASFIGAALLYWLTVGPVRGFAFFLGLSTLLDVVVAYFFTRPTVAWLGRSRLFTSARYVGVARGLATPEPTLAGTRA